MILNESGHIQSYLWDCYFLRLKNSIIQNPSLRNFCKHIVTDILANLLYNLIIKNNRPMKINYWRRECVTSILAHLGSVLSSHACMATFCGNAVCFICGCIMQWKQAMENWVCLVVCTGAANTTSTSEYIPRRHLSAVGRNTNGLYNCPQLINNLQIQ